MKKFGKYFVLLVVALMSAMVFTACGDDDDDDISDNKIVGTWKLEYAKTTYKENGKVVEEYEENWNTWKLTLEFASTENLIMDDDGIKDYLFYKYQGNKLTITDMDGIREFTVKKLTGNKLVLEATEKYVEDGISCEDYAYMEFSRLK